MTFSKGTAAVVQVKLVRSKADADVVLVLAYEFIDWLRERYPEWDAAIDTYLEHQKFDEQIKDVLIHYAPPRGECLLATRDGTPVGIVMLKDLGGGVCEMNRMFVRENARGLGVGRALVHHLTDRAIEMGFRTMNLSTGPRHHEAIALYRSAGFQLDDRPSDPGNPDNAVLMKIDLAK